MHKTRPVTFNIPKSNTYESTSISSFKGIQYSDNPLAVDSDSASDLLNVYLNDSGTLTTRPRIELEKTIFSPQYDVISRISFGDIVLYKVSDKTDSKTDLYLDVDGVFSKIIADDVVFSEKKISAFKKDDAIYVLDDGEYYVIKKIESHYKIFPVLNDVDTTMPVLKTISAVGSIGVVDEKLGKNVLSDKYATAVIWDGKTDFSSLLVGSCGVENNYLKKSDGFYAPNSPLNQETLWTNPVRGDDFVVYSIRVDVNSSRVFFIRKTETGFETREYDLPGVYVGSSPNGRFLLTNDYYEDITTLVEIDRESENLLFYSATSLNLVFSVVDNDGVVYGLAQNGSSFYLKRYRRSSATLTPIGSDVFISDAFSDMEVRELRINRSCSRVLVQIVGRASSSSPWKEKLFLYDTLTEELVEILSEEYRRDQYYSEDFTYRVSSSRFDAEKEILHIGSLMTDSSSNTHRYSERTSAKLAISNLVPEGQRHYISEDGSVYIFSYDSSTLESSSRRLMLNFVPNTYDKIYEIYDVGHRVEIMSSFDPEKLDFFIFERYPYTISEKNAWFVDFEESTESLLKIFYKHKDKNSKIKISSHFRFQNNHWFYGESNRLWRTSLNDPTYIEDFNYIDVGDDSPITGTNVLSDNLLAIYKENSFYLVARSEVSDGVYVYTCTETKGEVGNLPVGQTITTKYSQLPISIDDSGIFYISQLENVTLSEHNTTSLSSKIDKKFLAEPNKKSLLTHNHRYWTYFIFPGDVARVYVYDNRTSEWYYWELPEGNIVSLWEEVEVVDGDMYTITKYITTTGNVYSLRTIDSVIRIDADNDDDCYSEYLDSLYSGKQEIQWFWESQILPLTITRYSKSYMALGYRKQLTHTGFLFTDTDENEEYSLDYSFKVYRKSSSNVSERSLSGSLNRVRSVLKKTYIPRINFLQIKIKNSDLSHIHQTNLPNTHNKLNLIQLKFKYKIMEETV